MRTKRELLFGTFIRYGMALINISPNQIVIIRNPNLTRQKGILLFTCDLRKTCASLNFHTWVASLLQQQQQQFNSTLLNNGAWKRRGKSIFGLKMDLLCVFVICIEWSGGIFDLSTDRCLDLVRNYGRHIVMENKGKLRCSPQSNNSRLLYTSSMRSVLANRLVSSKLDTMLDNWNDGRSNGY